MKFPYGLSDFVTLIQEGYFYQDRTDRIPPVSYTHLDVYKRQMIWCFWTAKAPWVPPLVKRRWLLAGLETG